MPSFCGFLWNRVSLFIIFGPQCNILICISLNKKSALRKSCSVASDLCIFQSSWGILSFTCLIRWASEVSSQNFEEIQIKKYCKGGFFWATENDFLASTSKVKLAPTASPKVGFLFTLKTTVIFLCTRPHSTYCLLVMVFCCWSCLWFVIGTQLPPAKTFWLEWPPCYGRNQHVYHHRSWSSCKGF